MYSDSLFDKFPFLNITCFIVFHSFFLQKDGDLFFFCRKGWSREGFIIAFLYAPGPLRVYVIMGKQSGLSLRVSPLSPSIGLRLPPYFLFYFFFYTKKPFCNFILCTVIIFSYYTRTKKGTRYFFSG